MQKKTYTGVEIEVKLFDTEDVVVASSTETTKPVFDGVQDPDDLPVL